MGLKRHLAIFVCFAFWMCHKVPIMRRVICRYFSLFTSLVVQKANVFCVRTEVHHGFVRCKGQFSFNVGKDNWPAGQSAGTRNFQRRLLTFRCFWGMNGLEHETGWNSSLGKVSHGKPVKEMVQMGSLLFAFKSRKWDLKIELPILTGATRQIHTVSNH